ncbi:hypothetical protein CQW23_24155 [Capsicum baccatum]|uniref:Lipoxygenase domain-containing protein n=1 Tax=Capsicum baccatum TaxID=33114 RepID=A0A2G2VTZ8_CAPBA|nr:hypothetical protein CQW23_24155 [Capsicum baccatum]
MGKISVVDPAWLSSQTPTTLCSYREKELLYLRENGIGKLEEWDKDYDYNVYNDFGDPDSSPVLARPVLGEFKEYPYPRRGRIVRPPSNTDPKSVRWIPQIASFEIYCPRVEKFTPLKLKDVLSNAQKAMTQLFSLQLAAIGDVTLNEFKNFEDVLVSLQLAAIGDVTLNEFNNFEDVLQNMPPKRRNENQSAPQLEDPLGKHVTHTEFRDAFTTLAQLVAAQNE